MSYQQEHDYWQTLAEEGNGVDEDEIDWKEAKERDQKEREQEAQDEPPF